MSSEIVVSLANSGNQPSQISLFQPQFDAKIRRVEKMDVMHFSILDIYAHYGNSSNPRTEWAEDIEDLKEQGFDVVQFIVQHQFSGRGQKETPCVSFKTFLRIAQIAKFKDLENLRQMMADVAHERFEEMANPGLGTQRARERDLALLEKQGLGKSEAAEFLQDRIHGIDGYKELMATVFAICEHPEPGKIVNAEYSGLFGMASKQLQVVLSTKHIRDRLPQRQYLYLRMAESDLTDVLARYDNLSMDDALSIVDRIVVPLGVRLRELCAELGVDPITNKSLLGGK